MERCCRTPHLHAFVRECTAAQLRQNSGRYEEYIPGDFEQYCRAMGNSGEWGDHVTLQVCCVCPWAQSPDLGCTHHSLLTGPWFAYLTHAQSGNTMQMQELHPCMPPHDPPLPRVVPSRSKQAAADYFGLRVCVLTSYPEGCFIEIEPQQLRSSRILYLSFWAEVRELADWSCAGQRWAGCQRA